MTYLQNLGPKVTPQHEPIPDSGQVENSAGGHSWEVDRWQRLRRFLILGTEGGSYYASERKLSRENVAALDACIAEDGRRTVDLIVDVSDRGMAPRNTEALFALAAAAGSQDADTRAYALANLQKVARIGTHLFQFVGFAEQFRGWGPALKKAVGAWYLDRDPDALAYQLAKYQQRDGWSHRDVLRLAKPRPERNSRQDALLAWAVGKDNDNTGPLICAMQFVHAAPTVKNAVDAIEQVGLSREMIPSDLLAEPAVWAALLDRGMPVTSMVRNLANMTRIGLLTPFSDATVRVREALSDLETIRKARVHPIQMLIALRTYGSGHGLRGTNTWVPVPQITDALDAAFYLAFENVEPTGKNTLLALDVSGSMGMGYVAGVPGLTPRDASAALALVTANTEPRYEIMGFSNQFMSLPITPRQRLDDAIRVVSNLPFAGTDCALPMIYAQRAGRPVDTFVVYTDSETWAGSIHPSQALARYRGETGIDARLVVVGMVSNGFTIADPRDAGMLDVVGFGADTPALISQFSTGLI